MYQQGVAPGTYGEVLLGLSLGFTRRNHRGTCGDLLLGLVPGRYTADVLVRAPYEPRNVPGGTSSGPRGLRMGEVSRVKGYVAMLQPSPLLKHTIMTSYPR